MLSSQSPSDASQNPPPAPSQPIVSPVRIAWWVTSIYIIAGLLLLTMVLSTGTALSELLAYVVISLNWMFMAAMLPLQVFGVSLGSAHAASILAPVVAVTLGPVIVWLEVYLLARCYQWLLRRSGFDTRYLLSPVSRRAYLLGCVVPIIVLLVIIGLAYIFPGTGMLKMFSGKLVIDMGTPAWLLVIQAALLMLGKLPLQRRTFYPFALVSWLVLTPTLLSTYHVSTHKKMGHELFMEGITDVRVGVSTPKDATIERPYLITIEFNVKKSMKDAFAEAAQPYAAQGVKPVFDVKHVQEGRQEAWALYGMSRLHELLESAKHNGEVLPSSKPSGDALPHSYVTISEPGHYQLNYRLYMIFTEPTGENKEDDYDMCKTANAEDLRLALERVKTANYDFMDKALLSSMHLAPADPNAVGYWNFPILSTLSVTLRDVLNASHTLSMPGKKVCLQGEY